MAIFLCLNLLFDTFFPTAALALTSGPTQPEVQAFTPVGTTDMVSTFTGDFNYNIPLLEVEGYPVNLSYNAGIISDQEASWVGLGWNINPGSILRNMRALPDDFNGEEVEKEVHMKPNQTFGVNYTKRWEVLGKKLKKFIPSMSKTLGLAYNNYKGFNVTVGLNFNAPNKNGFTGSLGFNSSGQNGLGISPSISFPQKINQNKETQNVYGKASHTLGLQLNSRQGFQNFNYKVDVEKVVFTAKRHGNGKADGSFSYSFANYAYVPSPEDPMMNLGLSFSMQGGIEATGLAKNRSLSINYNTQFLKYNGEVTKHKAYGYMNMHKCNYGHSEELYDFNREKSQSFTPNTPNLPISNFTYDVYGVSGQGIGGTYRPHRSDVGMIHDPFSFNASSTSGSLGLEFGASQTTKVGVDVAINWSDSYSGLWFSNNYIKGDRLNFKQHGENVGYEPWYFKQAGEKVAESDPDFFNDVVFGFNAVRLNIDRKGAKILAKNEYVVGNSIREIPVKNTRKKRDRRTEVINALKAEEAQYQAIQKNIQNYRLNDFTMYAKSPSLNAISENGRLQVDGHGVDTQISEISAYRADGARYVYGIPAYNLIQDEVTFSIDPATANPDYKNGLATYFSNGSNPDNSSKNNKGIDKYFSRTTLPPYAHSYLLTAILSPDYVDVTGNGPSSDDLGSYTKINYTRIDNYNWRIPFEKDKAAHNPGLLSIEGLKGDDKANYTYGRKDIWYVHSIESKNYIALFTLKNRQDGLGVIDKNGGKNKDIRLQRIDKIELYTKNDYINSAKPTPIKTVNFKYNYSLCPGIPNNSGDAEMIDNVNINQGGGKLTLTQIYFTYGNSLKGRFSPYTFTYADRDHDGTMDANKAYCSKANDRWGTYKPNEPGATYNYTSSAKTTTAEFPYTDQDKAKTDEYAAAWSLTDIQLPSGGKISVDYESDDYSFVQDKRAMQMFKVMDCVDDQAADYSSGNNKLFEASYPYQEHLMLRMSVNDDVANYIKTFSSSDEYKEAVKNIFFKDENGAEMQHLYFRFLINLARKNTFSIYGKDAWEYVSGYAKINYGDTYCCGYREVNGKKFVYVKLEKVKLNDNMINHNVKVHPVSMAGFNFTKMHLPFIANNDNQNIADDGMWKIDQLIAAVGASFKPIVDAFRGGVSNSLRKTGASSTFVQDKSFVRLYCPSPAKLGGGIRVKKITLNDNWVSISQGGNNYKNADYGQEYNYTTQDANKRIISSGVAAYEPIVGGDENPFKQPVFYKEEHLLAPDDDYFLEKPFGEAFFPSPQVGYSKVTVRSLTRKDNANNVIVNRHATGKVVHEFYTAKDFPTQVRVGYLDKKWHHPNPVFKILKLFTKDRMGTSQGYVIELNDMHGKPKSQFVYEQGKETAEEYISGIEYKYKRNKDRLVNQVPVLYKDGTIKMNEWVGVDYDFVLDTRENIMYNHMVTTDGNIDGFLAAVFPAIIPSVWPSYTKEEIEYKSAVVTKIMNSYGLLDETIAYSDKASISTKNKLYDAETGSVLLTETKNAYEDNLYSFTYPAHLVYENMGGAYKNLNVELNVTTGSNQSDWLIAGDELMYTGSSGNTNSLKGWVVNANPLKVINELGAEINFQNEKVKVLRSGRRNQGSVPVASFVSLSNPMVQNGNQATLIVDNATQVISASASEFNDNWKMFCECGNAPGTVYNPYLKGMRGNWRAYKTYAFLSGRTQTRENNNTNIRKDGPYTGFAPFWTAGGGTADHPLDWVRTTDGRWQYAAEMTIYSPYGVELENKDPLNRYSSAQYGYNNMVPVAVSANSKYKQSAFDGFEDYDFRACEEDHLGFKKNNTSNVKESNSINQKYSHTGRRSIKVKQGERKEITKVINPCE